MSNEFQTLVEATVLSRNAVPSSQNKHFGFYGTIANSNSEAATRDHWASAFHHINNQLHSVDGKPVSRDETRAFLDAKGGRHLADHINQGNDLSEVSKDKMANHFGLHSTVRAYRQSQD